MSPTEIGRAQWNALCPSGDPLDCAVTVRSSSVSVEADDGLADVSVYVREDGVDVRVGGVQFVVKGGRLMVVRARPPYPISRWTILWEGDLGGPS